MRFYLFTLLALSLTVSLSAKADGYDDEDTPTQQEEEYQDFEGDLDDEDEAPQRRIIERETYEFRETETTVIENGSFYCPRRRCAPSILPAPGYPVMRPVPMPRPLPQGLCHVEPRPYGWAVIWKYRWSRVEVARGWHPQQLLQANHALVPWICAQPF